MWKTGFIRVGLYFPCLTASSKSTRIREGNRQLLKITECKSLQDLQDIRGEWGQLVEASDNATVFAGWEWAEAFWQYSAPGKKPLILLARDEQNRLVGVLPMARSTRMRMVRVLEVLGCNEQGYPIADYGGMLAKAGVEAAVWAAMLRHIKRSRWTVMDFRNCIVPTPGKEKEMARFYSQAAAELGLAVKLQQGAMCRRISLPANFDEYMEGLSPKLRKNTRRSLKKLAELGCTIEHITTQDEVAFREAFQALILYHQARWAHDTTGGGFPDQRSKEMHFHIARSLDRKGQLDLRAIRGPEKQILGVMYNLRHNGVTYFYGLGISMDEEYSALSLGNCLLVNSISAAIESSCHTFDMMRGDHDYKRRFGGYALPNLRVTMYHYAWLPRLEQLLRGLRGLNWAKLKNLRRSSGRSLEAAPSPQQ